MENNAIQIQLVYKFTSFSITLFFVDSGFYAWNAPAKFYATPKNTFEICSRKIWSELKCQVWLIKTLISEQS